jgi:hypothetical protein
MFCTCRMWPCERDCCMVYTLFKHTPCGHTFAVDLPPFVGSNRADSGMLHRRACRCAHQHLVLGGRCGNSTGANKASCIKQQCLQERHNPELAQVLQQLGKLLTCLCSQHQASPAWRNVTSSVACERCVLFLHAAICHAVVLAQPAGLPQSAGM